VTSVVRLTGAVLGLLLVVACGSSVGSGGLNDLRGRTFLSTGVTENGSARQLVAGTRSGSASMRKVAGSE
jgi:hypothetical protein